MAGKNYTLTDQAKNDLQEAVEWSLNRWNVALTDQYFEDLHKAAQFIAENQSILRTRTELSGDTGLCIYPVREHYIIYLPYSNEHIIIVSIIRQVRDIPTILKKRKHEIRQSVLEIMNRIENGKIHIG